ncbi:MAG TPA: tetratricopeptide repeat protein [Jatrophihabitans sp.]|jgi:putative thioredoxin
MAGAVDLAAVKARSEAAARAAEAPGPTAGSYVVQVTEANFQSEILDRSFQVPVLLVVTSSRAASAAPMVEQLEAIATEGKGALVLGKVDADTDMRVVQALQVQAVPTVFAVIGGRLVPGFEGVLPDDQLREFIGAVLQAAAQAGLNGPGMPAEDADAAEAAAPETPETPEDPRFDDAEAALADGEYELARQRFQAILDAEPANAAAALALRQVDLLARVDAAGDAAADPAPDDVAGQLAAADLAFVSGDGEAALRRLLDLLVRTSGDERENVRERLIEYFDLLGPDDPLVAPARREMARALF